MGQDGWGPELGPAVVTDDSLQGSAPETMQYTASSSGPLFVIVAKTDPIIMVYGNNSITDQTPQRILVLLI